MSLPTPRPDIDALEGYHSPQVDVPVRLNTNESPYPPPPAFVDAWLARLREVSLNRYPDRGAGLLRTRLAEWLGQPEARVFCANGSNEVLQTLLLAYGGPGRRALVFEPTYALHSHIANITGTEVVEGDRSDDFTISPTEARRLIESERPAVVFVCSPNNPTGTVETRDDRGDPQRRDRPRAGLARRRRGLRRVRGVERGGARRRRRAPCRVADLFEGVVARGAAARVRDRPGAARRAPPQDGAAVPPLCARPRSPGPRRWRSTPRCATGSRPW